ncbi:MAG: lycopene cyclase domain protein [Pseudonocardiales bacterium]|nr:lycopene cyclase domain protein [Jatrophihabitantaceae bacterium]MCW2603235.1 lycopene cyclase domain protein [Pseudonocardiales bacterium]
MSHLVYVGLLAACLIATLPLEIVLRTRVYARWRRLLLALIPTVAVFSLWDIYAIAAGHWTYDRRYLTGIDLPGHLPLDEVLFFAVTPTCAILTLEAVRRRRPHWLIGDER